jgi:uncharacterized protein
MDLDALWTDMAAAANPSLRSHHGPDHWARVERNGVWLAQETGADERVVRLFALLHDAMREDEGMDPEHGRRAAAYAARIRKDLPLLDEAAFAALCAACAGHVDGMTTSDPTVGTCWDADRLDLLRIGVVPHPPLLCTAPAIRLAGSGDFERLKGLPLRRVAGA